MKVKTASNFSFTLPLLTQQISEIVGFHSRLSQIKVGPWHLVIGIGWGKQKFDLAEKKAVEEEIEEGGCETPNSTKDVLKEGISVSDVINY